MSKFVEKTKAELENCKESQRKIIKERSWPFFAPSDGICFKCHKNIYQNYEYSDLNGNDSISYGYDGKEPITGCPHCNRSFCD